MSKSSFLSVVVLTVLGVACELASITSFAAESASLEALQGKWSAKRAGQDGQTLTLEIDGQKVTFGIAGSDGQTRFVAKGSAKAVQMGPLKVLQVSNSESGRAVNELKASDETYSTVYTFHEGALVMANESSDESWTRYEYRYDERGNWIERVVLRRLAPEATFHRLAIERRTMRTSE